MPQKRTIPRTCERCNCDFLARLQSVKDGKARFCSSECAVQSRRGRGGAVLLGDGTALIPLHAVGGMVRAHAVIDSADAEWAAQWRWSLGVDGYVVRTQHVTNGGRRGVKNFRLHRELVGLTNGDGFEVDHINRDRLDNRRSNLRVTTRRQNSQNMPSQAGTSSQHRGVTLEKRTGKWVAQVQTGGKGYNLGSFASEEEAAAVAREARLRMLPGAVD